MQKQMQWLIMVLVIGFINKKEVEASKYQWVRIPTKNVDKELFDKNSFIRDHKYHKDFIFGYLAKDKINLGLRNQYNLLELNENHFKKIDFNGSTLEEIRIPEKRSSKIYEPYHTYETLTEELKNLAAKHPNLAKLESVGKTVQKRDLWLIRLSNYATTFSSRPKLLFISSMHGDEVTGKEMMMYLIRDFLTQDNHDARLTNLLNHAEIFIIPSMNPDGTELGQRWNANDADLNRNFPKLNEPEFSIANREPETLALMELHKKHHFAIAMNFHGGELCVNIPWDSQPNQKSEDFFGDNELMVDLANTYASHNLPMYEFTESNFVHGVTYGYEWFQILGGMQDWTSFFRQSTHATLEISRNKWPSASLLPQFWSENKESMISYLEGGLTGIHLKVTNERGDLLPVKVGIDSATRLLSYEGYVHRPSVKQSQRVTVSANGYQSQTITMDPKAFNGEYLPVILKK